ncbi:MAG: hypothetical protein IKT88_01355 [Lachnospiraceae bacterium]|nr:hypothetical protein [Lachnospiraceae bacterium]
MKWILMLFIIPILWNPLESYGASKTTSILSLDLENTHHHTLLPGDTYTETFLIKNLSSSPIKVRLCQVTNQEDSRLFPVLQGSLKNTMVDLNYHPLDTLTTEWFSLDPKEMISLPLSLHFPKECGNDYQNADLKAKFLFEFQYDQNISKEASILEIPLSVSQPVKQQTTAIPSTGDSMSQTVVYFILWGSCSILWGLLHVRKRNKGVSTHD